MKQVLKDLWYQYLMDECGRISTEEEKKAVALLAEVDEQLMATMNDEQKRLFEQSQNYLNDVYAVFAEKAFEKGLVFSFEYLLALLKAE